MASAMTMVYSSSSLKMDIKLKSLIFGSVMATHGKFKELMSNIKFTSMVRFANPMMPKELKDPVGRNVKLLLQEPMILQFQDTLLLIQLGYDYGNPFL